MGDAHKDQSKLEEAINFYNKALALKPDYESSRVQKLHQQAHICDWDGIDKDIELLPRLGTIKENVSPFALLSLEDAPERHRTRSEIYAKARYPQKPLPRQVKPSQKPKHLKIGYFSADFHNHATMYLMAQIFAAHNKVNFEIFAYSYGPDQHDEMRKKLVCAVDQFYDVREMSDMQIANLARTHNIDIAIDLKGYTKSVRLAPFAYGLAPLQISYLGYPGTLGADFIDYIVADPILIPDDKRQHYSEQIVYLPHTYQPTDNTRVISDKAITREDMGLPDSSFVFCCFNNNYKISPAEFNIWMRLLNSVEGSVLWLLKSNKYAEQNLKRQAEVRGISSERVIFAERAPQAEHLARQRLADLFLDTFNYNAHTTTSDALWAGLPVVTKIGQGFAARVAGSLLNAIGLPELVTMTEQDYEELILELATNPAKLAQVKDKLATNRLTQPLFNTELYTKHLENGYHQAYQNYFDGNPPQTITVPR
jgi:predicted O-linked N-acetylglucosamine transferase (SPINDLY family)